MVKQQGSFYFEGSNDLGILLCPGLTRSPDDLREMGHYLNKLDYSVSCIQYRGHGTDSNEFNNTNVTMWYEDTESAFLELKNKVRGIYVLGHSMGGTFTVKLAQNHDVLGLVTLNAPLIGFPLKETYEKLEEETDNYEKLDKELKALTQYNKFVIETGQISNLNKITAPLLVIQGAKDTERFKISSSMLTEYTKSKYKSRLDFKKSGHIIICEEEKLDLFDLIKDFLCEIEKLFN